jgi:hypothetical protein
MFVAIPLISLAALVLFSPPDDWPSRRRADGYMLTHVFRIV